MIQNRQLNWNVLLRTVLGVRYLPTEKQKPQIDFLRLLCYNGYGFSPMCLLNKGETCDKSE